MNDEAKSVIDSLVKARVYAEEQCTVEVKSYYGELYKQTNLTRLDAVWEGYLTVVAALYGWPQQHQYSVSLTPDGKVVTE